MRGGVAAEFGTAEAALEAARGLRALGYVGLDLHSPYPLHGAEEALGVGRSRLPAAVLLGGILGGSLAYLFQWWMNVVDYPLLVGGRPAHFPPAFVPITFELTALFAAFAAVGTLFGLCGLPRLWHPVFEAPGFERATIDRFWLAVDARDPCFDPERTAEELQQRGALTVNAVGRPR